MSEKLPDFERLGVFYLGKILDTAQGQRTDQYLLYDSKDLTTHAVCVGMTGSGKTGLCIALLEEAAIDGVPAIAIDPKGDLGNLLLTFPELRGQDFAPWVDAGSAVREGLTREAYAERVAERWRAGLAEWDQSPARIAELRRRVDLALYTPGSSAGRPLAVLGCFDAPPPAVRADGEALRDRLQSAVAGLLALLGIEADPLRSREQILLSTLLERAWREGRDMELAELIRQVQSPGLERVGVFDLESFYPATERLQLAMLLNNLLASPDMSRWVQGEPLDVQRLLYTAEGQPRLSILSLAHLSDAERMFFVTLLLGEVVAWMRGQPGTPSLRAILYMDEVFGFFPPVANPPSKTPMLTLLKQARAYGLGVVLATQNPVDLDYKGLANAGTWLLGRLQTERDKARVLEGLEGASAQAGSTFDRERMAATLAGLGSRVFLMNNVHEDAPVVFESRWALSYLRGPLTREQIAKLVERPSGPVHADRTPAAESVGSSQPWDEHPAVIVGDAEVRYAPLLSPLAVGERLVYRPALLGHARLHFVHSASRVDVWSDEFHLRAQLDVTPLDWQASEPIAVDPSSFREEAQPGAAFAPLNSEFQRATRLAAEAKKLRDAIYRHRVLTLYRCAELKIYSQPGESQSEFRARLGQSAREQRDRQLETLRRKYAPKLASLESRLAIARERVAREQSQYEQARLDSLVSMGSSVLGALLGRKLTSRANLNRASSSVRRMGRAAQQQADVARAEDRVEDLEQELVEMQREFQNETMRLEQGWSPATWDLETVEVRPRKSDLTVQPLTLLWIPWRLAAGGALTPAWQPARLVSSA